MVKDDKPKASLKKKKLEIRALKKCKMIIWQFEDILPFVIHILKKGISEI